MTSSNKEENQTTFDNEYFVYVVLDATPDLALIGLDLFCLNDFEDLFISKFYLFHFE